MSVGSELFVQVAKASLSATFPSIVLANKIAEIAFGLDTSSKSDSDASSHKLDIKEELDILERKAKIAQEVAIARRIEAAEEVEMEEYYDYSGKVNIGSKSDVKGSVSIGAGASGQRISKRVYKFKGDKEWGVPRTQVLKAKKPKK